MNNYENYFEAEEKLRQSEGLRPGIGMLNEEMQNKQIEELFSMEGENLRLDHEQYTGEKREITNLIRKGKNSELSTKDTFESEVMTVEQFEVIDKQSFNYDTNSYGAKYYPCHNEIPTMVSNNLFAINNTNNYGMQPFVSNNNDCIALSECINSTYSSSFVYTNGVLSYYDAVNDKYLKVGNMRIDILSLIIKVLNEGVREYSYLVRVRRVGMYDKQCLVNATKIKERPWLIAKTNSTATFYDSKVIRFEDYIQWILDKCEYDQRIVYAQSGWVTIRDCGERYVTSLGVVGFEGRDIWSDDNYYFDVRKEMLGSNHIFEMILRMASITKSKRCSVPLIMLTHLAVLRKKFEHAGFPPKFIMAYLGETNSKKTSIALAMTQFMRQKNTDMNSPQLSFESTKGGIECSFSGNPDAVLIIDDFRPANDKGEEQDLRQKLELVTRTYGDQNSIKRMPHYSGIKVDNKPVNTCLITGEIVAGGNPSSMARIINIITDRTQCNDDVLSYYQQNPWILSTYMYDFITYITNAGGIIEYIKQMLLQLRNENKNTFRLPRNCDAFCIMQITIEIMFMYAYERGFINEQQKKSYINEFSDIIVEVIQDNDYEIIESRPQCEVVKAINKAISDSDLVVYDLSLEMVKHNNESKAINNKYIGYKSDSYLFIKPDNLLDIFRQYYKWSGDFPTHGNRRRLKELLVGSNLIEIYPGKERRNTERLPMGSLYDSSRYYYLKLETFMSLLED